MKEATTEGKRCACGAAAEWQSEATGEWRCDAHDRAEHLDEGPCCTSCGEAIDDQPWRDECRHTRFERYARMCGDCVPDRIAREMSRSLARFYAAEGT